MKLQNKETGQVKNFCIDKDQICSCDRAFVYDSLAQLQEAGWEDYEEPKGIIGICQCLPACPSTVHIEMATEGVAEKAVEKLKAWKRLKDKGFFFDGWTTVHDNTVKIRARVGVPFLTDELTNDLDLLFGGEK